MHKLKKGAWFWNYCEVQQKEKKNIGPLISILISHVKLQGPVVQS